MKIEVQGRHAGDHWCRLRGSAFELEAAGRYESVCDENGGPRRPEIDERSEVRECGGVIGCVSGADGGGEEGRCRNLPRRGVHLVSGGDEDRDPNLLHGGKCGFVGRGDDADGGPAEREVGHRRNQFVRMRHGPVEGRDHSRIGDQSTQLLDPQGRDRGLGRDADGRACRDARDAGPVPVLVVAVRRIVTGEVDRPSDAVAELRVVGVHAGIDHHDGHACARRTAPIEGDRVAIG